MKTAWAIALCLGLAGMVHADDGVVESTIRPLFLERCGGCHGPTVQKGGLRLDVRSQAMRGGESGPVIQPGDASASELIRRLNSDGEDRMPPEGERLSADEIAILRDWIQSGANWPETDYDRKNSLDSRLEHWAWKAVSDPAVPVVSNSETGGNEIDAFLRSRQEQQGLRGSAPTDRRTLIRRLSFDLHGLPPSYEDVKSFEMDSAPDAVARLVDRLLESPRYGERWARHWLDIAHYADTHGFERDQRRDHAWRYRDWVICALNEDVPYDRFLRLQIAGDVLAPEDPSAVIATGFLAAGPWDFVGQAETPSPVLKRQARADDLDDLVTQVMTAACGVTVNCARCHDHKLDPIPMHDYYALWAVFSGVRRGDRVTSPLQEKQLSERRAELNRQLTERRQLMALISGRGLGLADLATGGDGSSSGARGAAIDLITGSRTEARRGFLEGAAVNSYVRSELPFVDGVVIPKGPADVVVSSTGLTVSGLPETSGRAWDSIRNGPVNSQFSTQLGGIDFGETSHSILSVHANAGITFDLAEIRDRLHVKSLTFRSHAGYFGQTPRAGASFHVYADGKCVEERLGIGRDDGLISIDIPLHDDIRFLTLLTTDHGNDIGHDQICFCDAVLIPAGEQSESDRRKAESVAVDIDYLEKELAKLPDVDKVYAVVTETPAEVRILKRGNAEDPGDAVSPGALSLVSSLPAELGDPSATDAERRRAFAEWVTSPLNPLTARVIVNRVWHHHFGMGIVDTPGDFGIGGGRPTHPELLDWLARRFVEDGWSLKSLHRRICLSAAYQQASVQGMSSADRKASEVDSDNRLLWRQNPRRLDAEAVRDSVLMASGNLNLQMYGPGYRDFDYQEEYAPVYRYRTADQPELWRRSIYRFVVRTTPDPFMTTLDCPNPANLTPVRSITTTALQALALMNHDLTRQQAAALAQRCRAASEPANSAEQQVTLAFRFALSRDPSPEELRDAVQLVREHGLEEICLALFNCSEFVFVD